MNPSIKFGAHSMNGSGVMIGGVYSTEQNGMERWTKPRNGTLSQIEACNLPLLKLPLQVISGTSSG